MQKSDDKSVLRSNYTRRGSFYRGLLICKTHYFYARGKVCEPLTLLGDNYSVPSRLGNYFARIRVALYLFPSLALSPSFSLARQCANSSRRPFRLFVDRCQNDLYPRVPSPRYFDRRFSPRDAKISSGTSPTRKFPSYPTPPSYSSCLPARLFTHSGRLFVERGELPVTVIWPNEK